MRLNPGVFDVWVFRRGAEGVEYLVLRTSQAKADRHFNGGRFWQVPSGFFLDGESVAAAIERELHSHALRADSIWAAEHTYVIYNPRYDEMQVVSVFAVETADTVPLLDPDAHSEFEWLPFDDALARVHYRGLKEGLQSVRDYVSGCEPAPELRLR